MKFDFGWGSAPDPVGESLQRSPRPPAGFRSRFEAGGGGGLGKSRERRGEGGGSGGEGKGGPQVTVEPRPLRVLLRH